MSACVSEDHGHTKPIDGLLEARTSVFMQQDL
jgi:hypothetical protein